MAKWCCHILRRSTFIGDLLRQYHVLSPSDIAFGNIRRCNKFTRRLRPDHEIVVWDLRVALVWIVGWHTTICLFVLLQKEWIVLAYHDFRVVAWLSQILLIRHSLLFLLELLKDLDRWLLYLGRCFFINLQFRVQLSGLNLRLDLMRLDLMMLNILRLALQSWDRFATLTRVLISKELFSSWVHGNHRCGLSRRWVLVLLDELISGLVIIVVITLLEDGRAFVGRVLHVHELYSVNHLVRVDWSVTPRWIINNGNWRLLANRSLFVRDQATILPICSSVVVGKGSTLLRNINLAREDRWGLFFYHHLSWFTTSCIRCSHTKAVDFLSWQGCCPENRLARLAGKVRVVSSKGGARCFELFGLFWVQWEAVHDLDWRMTQRILLALLIRWSLFFEHAFLLYNQLMVNNIFVHVFMFMLSKVVVVNLLGCWGLESICVNLDFSHLHLHLLLLATKASLSIYCQLFLVIFFLDNVICLSVNDI